MRVSGLPCFQAAKLATEWENGKPVSATHTRA
jgi:hypothetical protein